MTPNNGNQSPTSKLNQDELTKLKKIYIGLIAGGLIIGSILSVGIVKTMNHFGLTERPGQLEQPQS